ncbi:hypothetical protein, partial [Escherichia marmotae]|uniref:hypothetical protein n=1 Tax=Escherichia marmotae TaxID=1499973 RepID=UPI0027E08BA2
HVIVVGQIRRISVASGNYSRMPCWMRRKRLIQPTKSRCRPDKTHQRRIWQLFAHAMLDAA